MTFLFGTSIAGSLCLLMIMAGYLVAGFLPAENYLTRLALANLTGLAWLLFAAGILGAFAPLSGVAVWLIWVPVLLTWLVPTTRNQLRADIQAVGKSPRVAAAVGGLALLWIALLLPYFVYPDLAFFDGKANHDNFFWSVGAEYLQTHSYLSVPASSRDFPLFNGVPAFTGWKPIWGRMGSEGLLAVAGSSVARSPVLIYNFVVCSLVLPWLLTVLAIARHLGLPTLKRRLVVLSCFCQPVLFFFIANGNLPNLLGTIFGGGLWLLALLVCDGRRRVWPVVVAGVFFIHGMLCSYPEILAFSLIPVALLVVKHFIQTNAGRAKPALVLALVVLGGLCLNPVTTMRTWNGMLNSLNQVHQDANWANLFARLSFAGYVPSLITLAMPSMRLYGMIGGAVASIAVLTSCVLVIRSSPRQNILLISLSGFAVLLLFTAATSFSYGWQKSAQFFGIHLAVLFPVLLSGTVQDAFHPPGFRRLPRWALLATLVVMVHGILGNTADNLKTAGTKGLTRQLLALRDRVASELPGQTCYVDGATFRAAFFQSMWSARIFARNPIVFLSRQEQAGGYLRDSVNQASAAPSSPDTLYYVDAAWAQAFDYEPDSLVNDRVGVLIRQHNLVTEMTGFYRTTGIPDYAEASFALTICPVTDGWLELTLTPEGETESRCRLQGLVTTNTGVDSIKVALDSKNQLVARFPLKAGTPNHLVAHIEGAPTFKAESGQTRYPFRVVRIKSGRTIKR